MEYFRGEKILQEIDIIGSPYTLKVVKFSTSVLQPYVIQHVCKKLLQICIILISITS